MIDTAKVRAEHVIEERWGGGDTGRDEGGICSECSQFWGPQCSDLDWCDALDAARRERDLAVAHDRQPYPTAAAYEAACAALEKHRARANEANAKLKAVRILIGKYQEFDKDLNVRHSAMLSAARNSTILATMDGADTA